MTEAATTAKTDEKKPPLELPEGGYPLGFRVMTNNPLAGLTIDNVLQGDHTIVYLIGQPHPVLPDLKVVRIYVVLGVAVEVYSSKTDGTMGVRHTIPWNHVRFSEEIMDPETFIEEVNTAEQGEDTPTPEPKKTNGAAAA